MKKIVIAAGILAMTASVASAQRPEWHKDRFPYAKKHHSMCHEKAHRLHGFERRAASDGKLSFRERWIMKSLRRDLDRTCGKFRWRG